MTAAADAIRRGAPDPDDAIRRFERITSVAEGVDLSNLDDSAVMIAKVCCQRAPYLATLLARDPKRLSRVAADPYLTREKPREVMVAELGARLGTLDDDDLLLAELRRYRADELVRLGVRELEQRAPAEVGAELAHLADASFELAITHHDRALRERYGSPTYTDADGEIREAKLSVIGMGKLGGEELNFSSDVDVIYVYTSDNGSAGDITLHEYFSKLCERVGAAIGEVTADDVVFRVDLRLRPEGRRGPIANSLPSIERYYEAWGRPWERQAWIKARPCAGCQQLGDEILDVLRPFVFPRYVSPSVIDDVTDLNRRIKSELVASELAVGFDLKNGVGGIREVEFFVQALQLIHAGRLPALRVRSTVGALDQLLFAGIISDTEHRYLANAYRFLRAAEHVLQLDSGQQTQRLPSDERAYELIAKRLRHRSANAFRTALNQHTQVVEALFATLGDDAPAPPIQVQKLLSQDLDPAAERELLRQLGFRDPVQGQRNLELARTRPASLLSGAARGAARRVAPLVLAEISVSPDPDQALAYLVDLIRRRGSGASVWRLMDDYPAVLRLVASLFGTSAYLSKQFVNHPELIDALLEAGQASARVSAKQLDVRLEQTLAPLVDDLEAWWNALAGTKNAHVLRIGLGDIAGELSADEVSMELSVLAEACLKQAFALTWNTLVDRHGTPRDDKGNEVVMAVIALGKLGGRELGYASDLDLIFVYSADGETDSDKPLDNVTFMTRLAQRLMSSLHMMHPGGRLYEIDTRLRPSGTRGLLVSSLAAWERYHKGGAKLWERQALTKLRAVAGDNALGNRVAVAAASYVYGHAPGNGGRDTAAHIAQQITSMRDKIEHELASRDGRDFKAGRGGVIDIEFASQYLQLVHGHEHESLRTTSTVEALTAAIETGVADAETCTLLIDGYRFLRNLEHRLRIVHDRSEQRIPTDEVELDKLARRVGSSNASTLVDSYRRWTTDVRSAYSALLGLDQ